MKKRWGDRVTTVLPAPGPLRARRQATGAVSGRRPRPSSASAICVDFDLPGCCSAAHGRTTGGDDDEGDPGSSTTLGQSLWLDNITRDLLHERHAQALHRRAVGDRAHLEPDHLRPRDQERARPTTPPSAQKLTAGQVGRGALLRAGDRGPDPGRRPLPPGPRADRRRRRLGVARGLAAARLRHEEHDRGREGAARARRARRTSSSRSRARRRACRRSRRRSSPACRST